APLNIAANAESKDYDGQVFSGTPSVSIDGLVNGDTQSSLNGTLSFTGSYATAKNAGNYIISPRGLTSPNYDVTFSPNTLTINKVDLEVIAKDATKTYDGLSFAGGNGVIINGFVSNETTANLGGALSFAGNSQDAKNVGTYLIRPRGYTSSNYNITYQDGTLNVDKALLTITAKDTTKAYDGLIFRGSNGITVSGLANNETLANLSGSLSFEGSAQGAVNAGDFYTIIPRGYSSNNYDIVYVAGSLTINKVPLTITAKPATKVYDGLPYTGGNGVTYNGFVNN